jgi:hypothetical protein
VSYADYYKADPTFWEEIAVDNICRFLTWILYVTKSK